MKRHRHKIIKPKCLNYGDTIGIVAPASSFEVDNFKKGVKHLRKIGYKVKFERSMFRKYWAIPGHDEKRAEQINHMFADKEVKAILCAKAGYGSIDIIPYLDKKVIRQNPKVFVGYSDITVLLLYLQKIANMVVFHGPVVSGEIHEKMNQHTLSYLLRLIAKPSAFGKVTFPYLHALKAGVGRGPLVGGNMTLIVATIGSSYEIDTDNKILFLEEIGENFGVLSNFFKLMKRAGKFRKIRGLIIGKMVKCFNRRGQSNGIKSIVKEVFADFEFPILYGFPSGHMEKKGELHFTLPLGVGVSINTHKSMVSIDEPAVV
ncbi:MAG: LD-carboxypeptidase [Candidatus Omnitrophota bacterium]|nr:MAG: LD-carboxypeptidase [Candidatus Omnitrophota bacterium]